MLSRTCKLARILLQYCSNVVCYPGSPLVRENVQSRFKIGSESEYEPMLSRACKLASILLQYCSNLVCYQGSPLEKEDFSLDLKKKVNLSMS